MDDSVHTEIVESHGYKHTIKLYPDYDADDPRDFDGNLVKFALSHKRYNFANELNINFNEFDGWDEIVEYINENWNVLSISWVRAYQHGDISISLSTGGQFSCPWDSGWLGLAVCLKDDFAEAYPELNEEELLDKADKILKAEFGTYKAYVEGDCYGYIVEGDIVGFDSCSGFYGSDEALEYAKEEIYFAVKHKLESPETRAMLIEALD